MEGGKAMPRNKFNKFLALISTATVLTSVVVYFTIKQYCSGYPWIFPMAYALQMIGSWLREEEWWPWTGWGTFLIAISQGIVLVSLPIAGIEIGLLTIASGLFFLTLLTVLYPRLVGGWYTYVIGGITGLIMSVVILILVSVVGSPIVQVWLSITGVAIVGLTYNLIVVKLWNGAQNSARGIEDILDVATTMIGYLGRVLSIIRATIQKIQRQRRTKKYK